MKFQQEFTLDQPVEALWSFFEQPELVAQCMPGVESIQPLGNDVFMVQATQKVGPLSATFESRLQITEKVAGERIAFNATGKAVRGAIGNFRAESVVRLFPAGEGTLVRVESEAALAGVLGSVGQKIIAKQAEKITAEFARTLEARLSGEAAGPVAVAAGPAIAQGSTSRVARAPTSPAPAYPAPGAGYPLVVPVASDGWSKVAAALALVNIAVGLVILTKLL